MTGAPEVFPRLRRYLHWGVAVLLMVQVPLAWFMVEQRLGPAKLENYALHKSLGIVLLIAGLSRILLALGTRRPALPDSMSATTRVLARSAEGILFLLLVLMPLTGWLMSSAANFPVSVFGWFTLPDLVAPDKALFDGLQRSHRYQSYLLLGLAALHSAAALRHYFVLHDNVLFTMLPLQRLRRK